MVLWELLCVLYSVHADLSTRSIGFKQQDTRESAGEKSRVEETGRERRHERGDGLHAEVSSGCERYLNGSGRCSRRCSAVIILSNGDKLPPQTGATLRNTL